MVEPTIVMLVTKIPCNSIIKKQDEPLNVKVNYSYQGPAIRGRIGAVVTQKTLTTEFDEIGSTRKEVYVDLPASDTPAPLYTDITGMPLSGCEPKADYGIKVYALDLDGKPEWGCLNVLTVTAAPEMETLEVKINPVGAGTVTVSLEPAGGTEHNWLFPHGTIVNVTAHPNPGYVFKSWSGEMKDTTAITAPVYPMTEKRTITAHFAAPPTSDIRDIDFKAQAGTYDLGDRVTFDAPYEYKGKAQSGWLTISLGTGVYPSFFTKHTFSRTRVSFGEAMDWTSGRLTGSFILPTTLEAGQTYNVRAKLETDDGKQETDTDWGVIKITEMETLEVKINPVGAGTVTVSLEPAGGTEHNWLFPHGTIVNVTAHPNPGYVFKSWSGEMTDTTAITAPVYPMTEKRTITAHFAAPPTSDIRDIDFKAQAGTYDLGARVTFDAPYEYKGKAQSGWLTISLGTGVYPSFFTKHTFSRTRVSFGEAMDWTSGRLTGSFTLPPTLEAGQTYSVRAKLETDDGKQETDTDWGVIGVTEAPPPAKYTLTTSVSPYGTGYVTGAGTYNASAWATIKATPYSGYEFDHWGGDYYGTDNPAQIVMAFDKTVTAYFRPIVPPERFTLVVVGRPAGYGTATKSPSKTYYDYGEVVACTAHPYSGHTFRYWDCDGEWLSGVASFNFMVTADHTLTAWFG